MSFILPFAMAILFAVDLLERSVLGLETRASGAGSIGSQSASCLIESLCDGLNQSNYLRSSTVVLEWNSNSQSML